MGSTLEGTLNKQLAGWTELCPPAPNSYAEVYLRMGLRLEIGLQRDNSG